jgi:hypothetical protein
MQMPKVDGSFNRAISLETDLFEHKEVKPHFINPCCFGEDFAAWLKEQLLPLTSFGFSFSDLIQEDYGWGFWAKCGRDPFWVAVSYVGDGHQEAAACWLLSVTYDPGLNLIKRLFHRHDRQALEQVRDRIRQSVASNPAFKIVPTPDYNR